MIFQQVKSKTPGSHAKAFESIVTLDRYFGGEYWDEFCLPSLLHPSESQIIWMLGTGLAGGLRPLLSTGKTQSVVGVDIDAETLNESAEIHHNNVKNRSYQPLVRDAQVFLREQAKLANKADIIWVDLFDETGHLPYLGSAAFILALKECLAPNGIVAINGFGLPCDLATGIRGDSYQLVRKTWSTFFSNIIEIPYRRNITFLLSNERFEKPFGRFSDILPDDQVWLELGIERLDFSRKLRRLFAKEEPSESVLSFASINQELRLYWTGLENKFGAVATPTFILESPEEAANYFLENNPTLSGLVSILLAANGIPFSNELIKTAPADVALLNHLPQLFSALVKSRSENISRTLNSLLSTLGG